MSTTNVDSSIEEPDVRLTIWDIENEREKPEITTGDHAESLINIEAQDGKNVFPLNVIKKDDGTIVVRLKQNGEIKTIPLNEYAAEKVLQNRKIQANPVPAKTVQSKGKTQPEVR